MKQTRWGLIILAGLFFLPQLAQAVTIEMVSIPGGTFSMGSYGDDDDETPVHSVRIRAFKMSKYEVTQAQYKAVMGSNPSQFKGDNKPVEKVNWFDAQQFIELLNRKTGKQYRLPTEAEWEYAARAGTSSKWSWGDSEGSAWKYAWYESNSDDQTHPVGWKKPNGWGLYDMHGNVWEWVEDCWNKSYEGAPDNGRAWESGNCGRRVLRGGSWYFNPNYLRSANRYGNEPDSRLNAYGFRLVQD